MLEDLNNEWKALKDQFEELTRRQSAPDIEEIFDAEIRRRFGAMIYRAATSKNLVD
jgi:hypothetical protein